MKSYRFSLLVCSFDGFSVDMHGSVMALLDAHFRSRYGHCVFSGDSFVAPCQVFLLSRYSVGFVGCVCVV